MLFAKLVVAWLHMDIGLFLGKYQIFLSTWLMVCFLFSSEQIEVCCDVLKKLLTALHPNIILHNFHSELLAGLQHPTSAVKKLCVTQVNLFFLFAAFEAANFQIDFFGNPVMRTAD